VRGSEEGVPRARTWQSGMADFQRVHAHASWDRCQMNIFPSNVSDPTCSVCQGTRKPNCHAVVEGGRTAHAAPKALGLKTLKPGRA